MHSRSSVNNDELLVIYLLKLEFTQAHIARIVCKSDAAINKIRHKLSKKLCGNVSDPFKAIEAFLHSL